MILKNKNAVVTGCNKGIGKKILETFSANGASIFACVRTLDDKFKTYVEELSISRSNGELDITAIVFKVLSCFSIIALNCCPAPPVIIIVQPTYSLFEEEDVDCNVMLFSIIPL